MSFLFIANENDLVEWEKCKKCGKSIISKMFHKCKGKL
jgi:hypothetical protein